MGDWQLQGLFRKRGVTSQSTSVCRGPREPPAVSLGSDSKEPRAGGMAEWAAGPRAAQIVHVAP